MVVRRMLLAVLVLIHTVCSAKAGESSWTAVTLARDGSWGAARATSLGRAITTAVRDCKAMSRGRYDCGAEIKTVRDGWILALLCGDYRVLAVGATLEEAEAVAYERKLELKYLYSVALPPCMRVLLIDPAGAPQAAWMMDGGLSPEGQADGARTRLIGR